MKNNLNTSKKICASNSKIIELISSLIICMYTKKSFPNIQNKRQKGLIKVFYIQNASRSLTRYTEKSNKRFYTAVRYLTDSLKLLYKCNLPFFLDIKKEEKTNKQKRKR